ncbi:phage holin family protein [Glaciimonas sp. CA11.2]|uniref:phage holin family protein n=1 Tax=Glaciimonas sp. CA11.2 TaxID=3048601 RepID=UPI002AB37B8A|nr:phage holin family protein [Glaciimonas sp. CA11.2]MDY7547277.1 phage holin family protein [Glaciimonas sp. CA11.2]MEB0162732.1 phage holin family protein [Glaciimonas sp. CA11.2]
MIDTAQQVVTAIAFCCYLAACGQLLCYRRGLANYRIHLSSLAWLLIALTGSCALDILLGDAPVSLAQAGLAFTLCIIVCRARGNVAHLLKDPYGYLE